MPEPLVADTQPLLNAAAQARWPAVETLALAYTQRFPAHPLGWKALAMAQAASGRDAQSLAGFQRAAELAPGDADAPCYLGHALVKLHRLAEAEAA